MAGVALWMVAAGTYPDYDGFTCRIPGTEEPCLPCDDKAAVRLVLSHTQRILALNDSCAAPLAAL